MIKNKTLKNLTIAGVCAFTGLTLAGYAAIISELHSDYVFSKGEGEGAWSSWQDVGSQHGCGTWSPLISDINYGTDFTQSQSCLQNQERTRDIYEEKSDGSKVYLRTEVDDNTITVSNTQTETGDKDFVLTQTTSAWSAWSDNGGTTNCSVYSPSVDSVNFGSDFTQSRLCSQDQVRTQTVYNHWAKGSQTVDSTNTDNQTLTNQTETQSATGDKDFILTQTTSAWSAWSNNGGVTNCGSYSPATNTIESGKSFTQTRYCSQPQKRTQTVYNVWAKGSQTVDSTNTGTQTLTNQAQTRSATGNRPLEWDYGTYITGYITSCGSTTTVRPRGSCSTKGATTIACGQVYHPGNNTYYKKSQYTCK